MEHFDSYDESNLELPADVTGSLDGAPTSQGERNPLLPRPPKPVVIIFAIAVLGTLIGSGVLLYKHSNHKAPSTQITINTQTLDKGTLTQLTKQADANGNSTQKLIVQPNTLFKQGVQVTDPLSAASDLSIGGNLSVKGSTSLQGPATFNGNLSIRGTLSVGGTLNAPSLNVGSLSVNNLTTTGTLSFGSHLIPTGAEPTGNPSTAAGGGTVTVTGNDTAGTISIITGNSPVAGELAIITFTTPFSTTPKVQLTPTNGNAANLHYYATHSARFMTIDSADAPTPGTTYTYDYLVTQ